MGYHDVSIDERVLHTIVDPDTQHMCSIRIE